MSHMWTFQDVILQCSNVQNLLFLQIQIWWVNLTTNYLTHNDLGININKQQLLSFKLRFWKRHKSVGLFHNNASVYRYLNMLHCIFSWLKLRNCRCPAVLAKLWQILAFTFQFLCWFMLIFGIFDSEFFGRRGSRSPSISLYTPKKYHKKLVLASFSFSLLEVLQTHQKPPLGGSEGLPSASLAQKMCDHFHLFFLFAFGFLSCEAVNNSQS